MNDIERAYISGQWHSLNRILDHLNTLDDRKVDKVKLFGEIMEMRPVPRIIQTEKA